MIKKLGDCRNDFLSTLYGKLSELKTCEKIIKKYLPEKIAQHCKVTDVRNDTIILTTSNAGILSLLRYEKSALLHKLRTEEKMYALRSIDLQLEPSHLRSALTPAIHAKQPAFSQKSCENIHLTADHCTYSPLKNALEKLEHTLKERTKT